MKKVCILQNSLNYGGTDTFVINLCEGLVKDGYSVTVVLSMDKDVIGARYMIYKLQVLNLFGRVHLIIQKQK